MSGMGMGRPFKVDGVYRIIERPRVLIFTWLPSWDEDATETLVRFDLDEQNGITTVRLTHSGFAKEDSRAPSRLATDPWLAQGVRRRLISLCYG